MNTINTNTLVTCQHCGKPTNFADQPHYKHLVARLGPIDPGGGDKVDELESAINHLRARAEQAEIALAGEKKWSNDLADQCCQMEDALGFKNDCKGPHGEFMPTMGPWKERVRDLIAKEGQLGDLLEGKERPYPIQDGPSVPWFVMAPHEAMAQKNHGQSLQRLAERGGLGSAEAWCVVNGICISNIRHQPWAEWKKNWFEYAEKVQGMVKEREELRDALKKCHETFLTLEQQKGYSTPVPPNIVLQSVIAICKALRQ